MHHPTDWYHQNNKFLQHVSTYYTVGTKLCHSYSVPGLISTVPGFSGFIFWINLNKLDVNDSLKYKENTYKMIKIQYVPHSAIC